MRFHHFTQMNPSCHMHLTYIMSQAYFCLLFFRIALCVSCLCFHVCERVYVVCVCVHVCVCVCVCVCACVLCYVCVATYSTQMKNHGVTFHLVNTHIHTHTHTHTHTHAHTHSLFLTVSVSHRVHTRRIRAFTRRATTSLSNVPKSIIKINFQ